MLRVVQNNTNSNSNINGISINYNNTKDPIILSSSTPIIKFDEQNPTITVTVDDQELQDIGFILKDVFLIFPQYCLGRGLMELAAEYNKNIIAGKQKWNFP